MAPARGEARVKHQKAKRYWESAGEKPEDPAAVDKKLREARGGAEGRKAGGRSVALEMENSTVGAGNKETISGTDDPFPGAAPIPADTLKKFQRGEKVRLGAIGNKKLKYRMAKMEERYREAQKQAAGFNILLPEEPGFLEVDESADTCVVDQADITEAVDITSASKYFNLELEQFGPYRINYTRNGRHLLMGGRRGHVAAMDWQTKQLLCEINVMESVNDIRWLHSENMFAVAQKRWLYIYDNLGIELHCVKKFNDVLRMEFLPYHFLLATCSSRGFLQYLDVSVGKEVAATCAKAGRLGVMAQNPYNAIIHLGHTTGTVTLWSPKVKEPLVKMLCHRGGVRAIAVDKTGTYMATSGLDKKLKIFDIRALRPLQSYVVSSGAGHLAFSQTNLLAAGCGNAVHVYKDAHLAGMDRPYMCHAVRGSVHGLQFCPYEDVLGIGHGEGFTSMLVPGAGEANFDALECNPYQSKRQRQEWEVKALLEKIQPELITLNPNKLGEIDCITMKQKLAERAERLGYNPLAKKKFEPKHKMKGRSSTGNIEKRKKKVAFDRQRDEIRESVEEKAREEREKQQKMAESGGETIQRTALDRFRK